MSAKKGTIKECELCGFPFRTLRSEGRYCTPACRQRAVRVRAGTLTKAHAEQLARDARANFGRACFDAQCAAAKEGGGNP